MKYLYYTIALVFIFTISMQAQENNSLKKAIEKGKSDLIELLTKMNNDNNFGIDSAGLQNSTNGSVIQYNDMDFDQLLKYQSGNNEIYAKTGKLVVPFMKDKNVVTTISVSEKTKNNFQISELINHNFKYQLNELPDEIRNQRFKGLKVIYVPNLNTYVYINKDKSYTSYNGRSLREGEPTENLFEDLKKDAIVFQNKYGDLIKKKKLLN